MESLQCVRNEEISVQLSVEEKTTVDEIVKQAEFSMESQELVDQSIGVVAENECLDKAAIVTKTLVGALSNQTKGPLTVMVIKIFEGHMVKNFPNPLKVGGGIVGGYDFSMASMFDKGIAAAVVYSGKNKAGVDCAWLLAFADTKATGKRMLHIYAKCGRKGKFSNINWKDFVEILNKAGTDTKAHDMETGTSLCATIRSSPINYRVGQSFVGATFNG